MHIGHKNTKFKCYNAKVHGTNMVEVNEDTYLGDIVQKDGKNGNNIQSRVSRGIGKISQIMNILRTVNFGRFFHLLM